jgi:hypothetical protein
MNSKVIKIKVLEFIYDLIDKFLLRKKFEKQISKLEM